MMRLEGGTAWQKVVVTNVTPTGLSIISDSPLQRSGHAAFRIFPLAGERIKAVVKINHVQHTPTGLYRGTGIFIERQGSLPLPDVVQADASKSDSSIRPPPACTASLRKLRGREDAYVVYLSGTVDRRSLTPVVTAMSAVPDGSVRVIFDMATVTRIDSSGIGVLISILERIEEHGGRAAICAVHDDVEPILEMIGVKELVAICADQAEALATLSAGEPT
jgi:anti-anti-sigma factor